MDVMKVNVEDINNVKKVLHIEIPEEDVTRELNKAYQTLKSTVQIKGFRPGKVPRALLERRFMKEMCEEVSGQLIQNSYGEAVGQSGLVPLGKPAVDRPDLQKGKPYCYSVTVEVRPPIADLKTKGWKLKKKVHTISEEEIDAQLKMLQKRMAQLRTVHEDRPAKDADVVVIDYEGFRDGRPLPAASKTENFQVQIGSGRLLKEFDQQLVGMEPNSEKECQVRFPDDYYNKNLAGLEVTFKVTLKEIKEEILPEIDDRFAQDLGAYQTLDELEEAIRKDLQKRYEDEALRQLREEVIDRLIEQSDFDLPEGLVQAELDGMVRNAQDLAARRGVPEDQAREAEKKLSERYRSYAERKVREYLLLQKVIEEEGLTLTDERLEEAYNTFAETTGQTVDTIKKFHEGYQDAYEIFRQKALEDRAVKWIIENGHVESVDAETEALDEAEPQSPATEVSLESS